MEFNPSSTLNFNEDHMHKNKSSIFLIFIFFLILFSVSGFWIIRGENPDEKTLLEGRYLKDFNQIDCKFYLFLKGLFQADLNSTNQTPTEELTCQDFQNEFEEAASDQFPFRNELIKTAKEIDRQIIDQAYTFTQDPVIPADINSNFYITQDNIAFIEAPEEFDESLFDIIDYRINNYSSLMETYPDINFYVYYIERIQNSQYSPLNQILDVVDDRLYYEYFLQNRPSDLTIKALLISSYDDHLKYFYRSDHHWNIHGILLAYEDIYAMIKQNFPEISEFRYYKDIISFPDINFQGSAARLTHYPFEGEKFEVVDYDLPPHKVFIDNKLENYGNRDQYFSGNYSNEPYFDHYNTFFGRDYALIEFVFDSQQDRNLLIIGNSYDNALVPLLASHYHKTYSIDLREFSDFSLSEFLAEHPVDDIIIIGENSVVFSRERYYIQP